MTTTSCCTTWIRQAPHHPGALNDNALFSVDNNGQLSLKGDDGENFEIPAATQPGDGTRTDVTVDGVSYKLYTVVLRATDPSRASDTVEVRVLLSDVNEAAEFQPPSKDQATLYIAEDGHY